MKPYKPSRSESTQGQASVDFSNLARILVAVAAILLLATTVACGGDNGDDDSGNGNSGDGGDRASQQDTSNRDIGTSASSRDTSAATPSDPGAAAAKEGAGEWGESRFYIELTEDDIEVQSFVDGTRWLRMEISDPDGTQVFDTEAASFMGRQGLSELQIDGWPSHFPLLGDPEHLEIPSIETYLELFPEGVYRFRGDTVERGVLEGEALFTHDLPALPEILSPADQDELAVLDPQAAMIRWEPVTSTFGGDETIEVVEYEVIVEQVAPFRKLSIHVPGNRTSLSVPTAFLEDDQVYDVEVVAIEASDNQTISSSAFRTSASVEAQEETDPAAGALKAATLYIELSEDDIELQSFTDGSRWDLLEIEAPNGVLILRTSADSFMGAQGLSELTVDGWPSHFPLLGDPEHLEIPSVEDFLALFPTGDYAFRAETVEGEELSGSARFTHDLPALPEILSPAETDEPEVIAIEDVVIRWVPVAEAFDGRSGIDVVEYEVVVEQVEPFRKLSIHLPASATEVKVPVEFLERGRTYEVEVMAIERSGNQTFSVTEFETAAP